jgi:hypothetical protein
MQFRAMAPFLPGGITVVHRSLKPGGEGAIPSPAARCGRSILVMPRFVKPTKSERYRPATHFNARVAQFIRAPGFEPGG